MARLLRVLASVVEACPASVIDKLWYLFSSSLLPLLGKQLGHGQFPHTEDMLHTMAVQLPWGQTRFLLYDPNSPTVLDKHLHDAPRFICGIFRQLDLSTFTYRLA